VAGASKRPLSAVSHRHEVADRGYNEGMEIKGSNPVLAVHDLEGSAEWLRVVLGCERTDPDPGNWVFCHGGTVTFVLGEPI